MKAVMFEDAKYAFKVLKSFLSGYESLAVKAYEKEEEVEWEQLGPGDRPNPYYVCLQFNDGRHLPLPIFDGWDTGDHVGPLQTFAVRASKWLFGSEWDKASQQVKSLLNDDEYDPKDGETPKPRFPELSLRIERWGGWTCPHFSFFVFGLDVLIMLDVKSWAWPRAQNYWHQGVYYGWSVDCGPIHIGH